jgi:transposase-like protein
MSKKRTFTKEEKRNILREASENGVTVTIENSH